MIFCPLTLASILSLIKLRPVGRSSLILPLAIKLLGVMFSAVIVYVKISPNLAVFLSTDLVALNSPNEGSTVLDVSPVVPLLLVVVSVVLVSVVLLSEEVVVVDDSLPDSPVPGIVAKIVFLKLWTSNPPFDTKLLAYKEPFNEPPCVSTLARGAYISPMTPYPSILTSFALGNTHVNLLARENKSGLSGFPVSMTLLSNTILPFEKLILGWLE